MIIKFKNKLLFILPLLFFFFYIPNITSKEIIVPLEDSGILTAKVKVGENVGVGTFIIDTGASITSINKKALEDLLKVKQAIFKRKIILNYANGDSSISKIYSIKELSINGFKIKDVEVVVHENQEAPFLLGMDVLRQLEPFTIDFDDFGNPTLKGNTKD